MALRSTVWISLIALASIADAIHLQSLKYCIIVREGDATQSEDTTICPGTLPRFVNPPITILSGFAPGTSTIPELRPKWEDELKISANANILLAFDASYCLISKESGGWRQYGCARDCYLSQERVKNPYYKFDIGDGRPDFSNPISGHRGWHFTPQPDNCPNPNTLEDRQANKAEGFLTPVDASENYASSTVEGITGNLISTPAVESLGDPDELVGYAQQLQPKLTTEDPSLGLFDSSNWNIKRGVVRKEGAVAISFQA